MSGHYDWNDASGHLSGQVQGATLSGPFNETHYEGTYSLTLGTGHCRNSAVPTRCFEGTYDATNKDTGFMGSGAFDGTCVAGPCLNNGTPPPPVVAPTPSAFNQTVSTPVPPAGGATLIDSPRLAAFGVVTAGVQGASSRDVGVIATKHHECFVSFTKAFFEHVSRYAPSEKQEAIARFTTDLVSYQLGGTADSQEFKDLSFCLALVDAVEDVTPNVTAANIARTSCGPIRPIKLSLTGSGTHTRLRSFKVGSATDRHETVQASCVRSGGTLSIKVAARSKHTSLSRLVGSRLAVGIVRHRNQSGGGQLRITFHHG